MIIGSHNTNERVFIVAEIGNNHEGSFEVAVKMIEAAARAGADAVKFQTIVPERFVRPADTKRMEQLKRFAFSYEQFARLKEVADAHGVLFLSTPFDLESVEFLDGLVPAFKIASGDNNFYPLLEQVAKTGKPIIVSTGFADIEQIRKSVSVIEEVWKMMSHKGELALLHCVSSYPVPQEQANLAVISTLLREFPLYTIGYSDHTLGIHAAVAAIALGARIIEKHFTLDKNYSVFRDHSLSADPVDLKELISRVREIEILLGTGEKQIQSGEREILQSSRRSIVAAHDMSVGSIILESDISWMRPGDGLPPGQEQVVLGKKLRHDVHAGEALIDEIVE